MTEKWYGENCDYQICQFEEDGEFVDRSKPVLILCVHKDNEIDCEGNCNQKLCPIRNK